MNDSKTSSALAQAQAYYEHTMIHGNFFQVQLALRQLNLVKKTPSEKRVAKKIGVKPFFKRRAVYCAGPEINIFILAGNFCSTLQITTDTPLSLACHKYGVPLTNKWASFNGKPINTNLPLSHYSVSEGCSIILNDRLCGGSNVDLSSWLPAPAGGGFTSPALSLLLLKKS